MFVRHLAFARAVDEEHRRKLVERWERDVLAHGHTRDESFPAPILRHKINPACNRIAGFTHRQFRIAEKNFTSGKIKLLGIDVEERSLESGPNFIKSHGMTWPHLLDIDSTSKFVFGMGVPVTWFIDANGDVIYKHIGAYRAKKELYDHVEKYFKVKL